MRNVEPHKKSHHTWEPERVVGNKSPNKDYVSKYTHKNRQMDMKTYAL